MPNAGFGTADAPLMTSDRPERYIAFLSGTTPRPIRLTHAAILPIKPVSRKQNSLTHRPCNRQRRPAKGANRANAPGIRSVNPVAWVRSGPTR